MYTQCPDCHIAFRVSAKVLQQAGGKVRCGGCDKAFNALDYLSEDMPDVPPPEAPSPAADLDETSKRLLETLDELAGPDDVRIEDTGVEWRVLDETEAAIEAGRLRDASDTGSFGIQDEAGAAAQDSLGLDEPRPPREERRYDDNSPLPEEFDDEDDVYVPPPAPQRRATDKPDDRGEFDEMQGDLALSEPGEWTDLLDEVSDADVIPLEVEEGLAAINDELTGVAPGDTVDEPDAAPLPEQSADEETVVDAVDAPVPDTPDDLDTQFELQAEALGITGSHEVLAEDGPDGAEDLTDEVPLLDDAGAAEETVSTDEETVVELRDDVPDDDAIDSASASPLHDDADELDISDTGADDALTDDVVVEFTAASADAGSGEDDAEALLDTGQATEIDMDLDETGELEIAVDDAAMAMDDADAADEDESGDSRDEDIAFEETDVPDLIDDVETITTKALDEPVIELLDDAGASAVGGARENDEDDGQDERDVGTADDNADDQVAATAFGDAASKFFDENSGEVETIIMEGDFVRGAVEKERLAAEREAQARISEASKLADTYAMNRGKVRGGRRSYDPPSYVVVIGVVVLSVLLLAQFVHASRDRFATSDLFNQTVAPVYRMLGQPITPEWDVRGWQFESTSGSTDDNDAVLTVVSRIANKAEVALPYPLVHVSLTDRWEEVIGSRVLQPSEYLAGNLDPSRPVTPGEDFTAVITIDNPAENATGFKLNVCYRVVPGRVRCAIEDFKD